MSTNAGKKTPQCSPLNGGSDNRVVKKAAVRTDEWITKFTC